MSGRRAGRARALAPLVVLLAVAAATRLPGVFSRSIWYDEAFTLVVVGGAQDPAWPREPAPAAATRGAFSGRAPLASLVEPGRLGSHPPAHFLLLALWRRLAGPSLEAARLLSTLLSLLAVGLFWRLLLLAGVERPLLPALLFAVTTGSVHGGHEARPYALAELLVVAAALAAWQAVAAPATRATVPGLAAALSSGLAVLSFHLAVFPAAAILVWLAVRLRRAAPRLALGVPLLAAAVGALGLPAALHQARAAPPELRGRGAVVAELGSIATRNAQEVGFGVPRHAAGAELRERLPPLVTAAFVVLLAVATWGLVRARPPLVSLALALALAPSLGVAVLDLGFGWHLTAPRYLSLATPGMALVLGLGLRAWEPRRWARWLLVLVLAAQATRVNWGFETCADDQTGSITRSMAFLAAAQPRDGTLVAVGAGFGIGDPASWAFELAGDLAMLVFREAEAALPHCRRFPSVWVALSSDRLTRGAERRLVEALRAEGYEVGFANPKAVHLYRPATAPAPAGPTASKKAQS